MTSDRVVLIPWVDDETTAQHYRNVDALYAADRVPRTVSLTVTQCSRHGESLVVIPYRCDIDEQINLLSAALGALVAQRKGDAKPH